MPRGDLVTGCDASTRGVRVARRTPTEAIGRDGVGRFYARGGGWRAAGHEPRYPAPRLRCGLGCPHGSGFDVRRRPRLEPGDLAGRALVADRLHGVDQIRRATFDVRDAGVAGRAGFYADASAAKVYAMLPNRCADRRKNHQTLTPCGSPVNKAELQVFANSAIRQKPQNSSILSLLAFSSGSRRSHHVNRRVPARGSGSSN